MWRFGEAGSVWAGGAENVLHNFSGVFIFNSYDTFFLSSLALGGWSGRGSDQGVCQSGGLWFMGSSNNAGFNIQTGEETWLGGVMVTHEIPTDGYDALQNDANLLTGWRRFGVSGSYLSPLTTPETAQNAHSKRRRV